VSETDLRQVVSPDNTCESIYMFDELLKNTSDIKPIEITGDSMWNSLSLVVSLQSVGLLKTSPNEWASADVVSLYHHWSGRPSSRCARSKSA
jgi:hypothetical protein